ncbi:minor coat protein [Pyrus virus A]|uniref:Minor coat protein n=1 Tax=Pyrus virus A TaxID=3139198 RepID=A0AAU6RVI4_9CLOS
MSTFTESYAFRESIVGKCEVEFKFPNFSSNFYIRNFVKLILGSIKSGIHVDINLPDAFNDSISYNAYYYLNGNLKKIDESHGRITPKSNYSNAKFDGTISMRCDLSGGNWRFDIKNLKSFSIPNESNETRLEVLLGEEHSKHFDDILTILGMRNFCFGNFDAEIKVTVDNKVGLPTKVSNSRFNYSLFSESSGLLAKDFSPVNELQKLNLTGIPLYRGASTESSNEYIYLKEGEWLRVYDYFELPDDTEHLTVFAKRTSNFSINMQLITQFWIGGKESQLEFVIRWFEGNRFAIEVWTRDNNHHSKSTSCMYTTRRFPEIRTNKIFCFSYEKDKFDDSWLLGLNGEIISKDSFHVNTHSRSFGTEMQFNLPSEKHYFRNNISHIISGIDYLAVLPEGIKYHLVDSESTSQSQVTNLHRKTSVKLGDLNNALDIFNQPVDISNKRQTVSSDSQPSKITRQTSLLENLWKKATSSTTNTEDIKNQSVESEKDLNNIKDDKLTLSTRESETNYNDGTVNKTKESSGVMQVGEFKSEKIFNIKSAISSKYIEAGVSAINSLGAFYKLSIENCELMIFQVALLKGTSIELINDHTSSFSMRPLVSSAVQPRIIALAFFTQEPSANIFRLFCRSNSQKILKLLRSGGLQPSYKLAIQRQLPKRFAHLAADFWDLEQMDLSDEEAGYMSRFVTLPVNKSHSLVHLRNN